MIALTRREFHLFQAAGRDFLYLVPSAAVFALDETTSAVLRVVSGAPHGLCSTHKNQINQILHEFIAKAGVKAA